MAVGEGRHKGLSVTTGRLCRSRLHAVPARRARHPGESSLGLVRDRVAQRRYAAAPPSPWPTGPLAQPRRKAHPRIGGVVVGAARSAVVRRPARQRGDKVSLAIGVPAADQRIAAQPLRPTPSDLLVSGSRARGQRRSGPSKQSGTGDSQPCGRDRHHSAPRRSARRPGRAHPAPPRARTSSSSLLGHGSVFGGASPHPCARPVPSVAVAHAQGKGKPPQSRKLAALRTSGDPRSDL